MALLKSAAGLWSRSTPSCSTATLRTRRPAYLVQVRQVDGTIDKQLRLSSPRVSGLVYAAGSPTASQANVMPWLGGLSPRSVGDLTTLASIAL